MSRTRRHNSESVQPSQALTQLEAADVPTSAARATA